MSETARNTMQTSKTPSADLICSILGKIFSEKYGCEITLTAEPKSTNGEGSKELAG